MDPTDKALTGTAISRIREVAVVFFGLGLTSFGGPVAHLGYFREAFVVRRKWLSESDYADLVALCQFLPGPASSQVGMAIGHQRAGLPGALAAWIAFTLPSVLLLYAVALGADRWQGPLAQGALHGLKLAALAVVAQAVWLMARRLTPNWPRRVIAAVAAAAILIAPFSAMPAIVIGAAVALGAALDRSPAGRANTATDRSHPIAFAALALFLVLLVALPLLAAATHLSWIDIADRFYRTGALVFGGGHVVLPLLQNELLTPGLINRDIFLAGYGAAQAVPGPLFSFAFYAGLMLNPPTNGVVGGLLALTAIYLPSFLLVLGALPYWTRWKALPRLRAALDAANAAVVGVLFAALCTPVFTNAVFGAADLAVATIALAALTVRAPPWLVVIACGAAGLGLARL